MNVARLDRLDAASVAAELGCSLLTAGRVAALMDGLGLTRAATSETKLLSNAVFGNLEIFYSQRRRHSSLGMVTPVEYEIRHAVAA